MRYRVETLEDASRFALKKIKQGFIVTQAFNVVELMFGMFTLLLWWIFTYELD